MIHNSFVSFTRQPKFDIFIGILLFEELLKADHTIWIFEQLVKSLGPLSYPGMFTDHWTKLVTDPSLLWILQKLKWIQYD